MSKVASSLPPGVDWLPVDHVLAALQDRCEPVTGTERLQLAEAAGRILAEDVTALRANPPKANSAVDGYGFAHAACEGRQSLPLVADRAAAGGPFEGVVPAGFAVRILTGANIPAGVDTVILQEEVRLETDAIHFERLPKPGANTRAAGEDVQESDVLLPRGAVLRPGDLALIAATGTAEVTVHKPLRVGVMSTGDEITEPGSDATADQIFDANRPMLLGLLSRWGMEPVDLGHVRDDKTGLQTRLTDAANQVDAILTSGGASAGDEDHMARALVDLGAMREWRVAVKPGRPLVVGEIGKVPVFGLPGNPVAAFVCTLMFARPALRRLAGADWRLPEPLTLPAGFSKDKRPGRREYLRARLRGGQVEVFGSEGSGRISGLTWAEGLVELPDEAATIRPGDPVRYLPFESLGF